MIKRFNEENIKSYLPGIVIMSHSSLAIAMMETAKFIYGEIDNIAAFSFEDEDNPLEYRDECIKAIKKFPENTIVFLDIFGGSPCNQLMMYIKDTQMKVNAIAGMSLPMVISAINLREMYCGEELLEKLKVEAEESIVNVTKLIFG